MATIDLDPGARLDRADRAPAGTPAGVAAWPSVDLASRRGARAAAVPADDGPDGADMPADDEPDGAAMLADDVPDGAAPEPVAEPVAEPLDDATREPVVEAVAPSPVADAVPAPPPAAAAAPVEPPAAAAAPVEPTSAHDPRRPATLLFDLTTAMRATAITARDQALAQVERDAGVAVETIRANSVETSKALRDRADEDIEGIRDWTKAEIARIRTESETRIADRRTGLGEELEIEAGAVEQHVFDVHDALARYQAEMAAFFERLVAETDAARLATMAETMPEPPALAAPAPTIPPPRGRGTTLQHTPGPAPAGELTAELVTEMLLETAAVSIAPDDVAEDQPIGSASALAGVAEPAAVEEAGPIAGDAVEATAPGGAEAPETAAVVADEPAPREDGRSFAERLAGLLPHRGDDADGEPQTTQVVVTGLASVASIASFKRQLSRVAGVSTVSVSSGPDGEFVFNAVHRSSARLAEAVPMLQGFGAIVSRTGEGVLFVAAQDPDAES